jgi:rhomboid family GlyGly-CTERM serine protease
LTVTCLVVALLPESIAAQLELHRDAIETGEIWRLWSTHVVHFSWRHVLVDGSALGLLSACVEIAFGTRVFAALILTAAPLLSSLLLLTQPELMVYRGASGLCMLLAVIVIGNRWRRSARWAWALGLIIAGLLIKTACEALGAASNLSGLAPDVRVVWQAHVFGVLIALGWLLGGSAWTARGRFFAWLHTTRASRR